MHVNVMINLEADEATPTKDVKTILTDLGGDPTKDTISVSVSQTSTPPPPVLDANLPQVSGSPLPG